MTAAAVDLAAVFVLACPTCGPRRAVRLAALTAAAAEVVHHLRPRCPACGDAQEFTEAQGDESENHDRFSR